MVVEPSDRRSICSCDDEVKRPNPAVLAILDPLHRSLLNNNLQYDQGKYEARDNERQTEWYRGAKACINF